MSAVAKLAPVLPQDPDIITAWDDLMSGFNVAKAADDDINRRFDAAWAAHTADKPAEPEIDTVLLFGMTLGRIEDRHLLIYRRDLDELQRQILASKGVTRWERIDRDPARIAELDKIREFRRLISESEERHAISALDDEWSAAGDKLSKARVALLLAPAPDYGAVRWKLDQLFGPQAVGPVGDEGRGIPSWDAELTDAVIADMARLGGAA